MEKLIVEGLYPQQIKTLLADNPNWVDAGNGICILNNAHKGINRQYRSVALKTPYLVQRLFINRPLGKFVNQRLAKACMFDYMGSAEFEFGSIPCAFLRMQALWPLYKTHRIETISITVADNMRFVLRIFTWMQGQQLETYVSHLMAMRESKLRLKEHSAFDIGDGGLPTKADAWFDIENLTIWSFDKNFMNRVQDHLEQQFSFMAEENN